MSDRGDNSPLPYPIFIGRAALLLLKPVGKVLGLLEAYAMRYLVDAKGGGQQQRLRPCERTSLDMLLRRETSGLADEVAEIIGGEAELVRTILHGKQSFDEGQHWNHLATFLCLIAAVYFVLMK